MTGTDPLTAERDAAKSEIVAAVLAIIRKAQWKCGAIDLSGWDVDEEITGPIKALVAALEPDTDCALDAEALVKGVAGC